MGNNVLERIAVAIEKRNEIEEMKLAELKEISEAIDRIYGGMP